MEPIVLPLSSKVPSLSLSFGITNYLFRLNVDSSKVPHFLQHPKASPEEPALTPFVFYRILY
jgi:hypothetical protein